MGLYGTGASATDQDSPEDALVAVRKFPEKGWDPSGMGNPSVKREY